MERNGDWRWDKILSTFIFYQEGKKIWFWNRFKKDFEIILYVFS